MSVHCRLLMGRSSPVTVTAMATCTSAVSVFELHFLYFFLFYRISKYLVLCL